MRFVVCGAGAIGGVVGGQLAKAGFDVVFLDELAVHVDAINRNGLVLKGVQGTHVLKVPAVTEAAAVGFRRDDVVVLAVKSFRTEAAVAELRRATALELPLFCAQNGVRNEEVAARRFRDVHGVMVLIGAKCLVPGEVVHTGKGPLGLGTWPTGLGPADREVAAALGKTELPVYTTENVVAHKWNKMLRNLNNATMGLTGLSGQEARSDRAVRAWMADVYEEGVGVLRAAGIPYEGPPGLGPIDEMIRELRSAAPGPAVPADEEARHYASLWQDLYHQRGEVEADYFNGEIVRLGRAHGLPTPYSSLLLRLISEMAAAREKPGKYTVEQLRARLAGGA
jgi:2-dehydropantoate 2-reductase